MGFGRSLLKGLVFCGAIGGCFALLPEPKPKTPAQEAADKLLSAMIRCENQTESQLADPEGFEPESYGAWRVEAAGEDDQTFRFKARARNAFGGMIWAEFECRARYDGKYWSAEISQL